MSAVTESDIKELKNLIEGVGEKITGINDRIARLETKFQDFEKGQIEMNAKLSLLESSSQKIPDLAEKVGELKNWKQIGLTLIGGIIGGVITYLVKSSNL